jgi:hypothetical protein
MNQKDRAIADLKAGKATKYKGHGNSMRPRILSGATVTIEPVNLNDLVVGDIVFCKVGGNVFVHKVTALKGGLDNRQVQIGNNRGHINGWTKAVYGRITAVEQPT